MFSSIFYIRLLALVGLALALVVSSTAFATNWTWSLSGGTLPAATGTFSACESTTKTKVTGSYSRPTTGFVHMVKSACSTCSDTSCSTGCTADTGECGGVPSDIYAVEAPGVHLIVQPTLSSPTVETQPIYNVVAGSCPGSFTSNFMFSQWTAINDTSQASQIGVGTFSWDGVSSAQVTAAYNLTSSFSSLGITIPLTNSGCSNGLITVNGTPSSDRSGTIYITNQGEFFYKTSANHAVFGVPQVTLSNLNQLLGAYSGFVYDASGTNSVTPVVNMTLAIGGSSVSGYGMTAAGAQNPSFQRTFTMNGGGLNKPVNGMIEGTLSDGTSTSNMVCVVELAVAGHNHLFCAGQKPGTASTPYNMLLTSAPSWTWIAGSSSPNVGSIGTQGASSSSYLPSARYHSLLMKDTSGNTWIFGGLGMDAGGNDATFMNDLWKFDGTNWTWVAGQSVASALGNFGPKGTPGTTYYPSPRWGAYGWIDANGKVWIFGGYGTASNGTNALNDLWKYDPADGTWTWVSGASTSFTTGTYGAKGVPSATNKPGGRSNGDSWVDSQGNGWIFGGLGLDWFQYGSLSDVWKWDGTNWAWMGGASIINTKGNYGTQRTPATTNVPGGRAYFTGWKDAQDNYWFFGGLGYDGSSSSTSILNDLWKWDGANFTWMSGSSTNNAVGIYGTKGITGSGNVPGARQGSNGWVDLSGNLWLWGGAGNGTSAGAGGLNDLWKFDGVNWTWVAGESATNTLGASGTKGTPNPSNYIDPHSSSLTWIDTKGNVYVFGGTRFDALGNTSESNELWRAFSYSDGADATANLVTVSDRPVYNYGTVASRSTSTKTFTLTNASKSLQATSLAAASPALSSPFSFTGGGYPGTGGTCGTSLAAGASCTVNVDFSPTNPGGRTFVGSLNLSYTYTGGATQTVSVALKGNN